MTFLNSVFIVSILFFIGLNIHKIVKNHNIINNKTDETLDLLSRPCPSCGNVSAQAYEKKLSTSAIIQTRDGNLSTTAQKCELQYYIECSSCKTNLIHWTKEITCNSLELDIYGEVYYIKPLSRSDFYPFLRSHITDSMIGSVGIAGYVGLFFWTVILIIVIMLFRVNL
mgnify:FL=1